MKKYILTKIVLGFLFLSNMACFDDKSSQPSFVYPDIVVKRIEDDSYLTATFGENFRYAPQLGYVKAKDTIWFSENEFEDYDYKWKMTEVPGTDTIVRVLSDKPVLDIMLNAVPSNENYTLILQLKHKLTGVAKQFYWNLKILGLYNSGLLVADTRDGRTSDLSLISSRCYNSDVDDYRNDKVHRDIYEKANGKKLEGIVSTLSCLSGSGSNRTITVLVKDKALMHVNPVSMKEEGRNEECFYYKPKVFRPQEVFTAVWGSYSVLINNGILHFYEARNGLKYSYNSESDYELSADYVPLVAIKCHALLFDTKTSRFLRFYGNGDKNVLTLPENSGVFNPSDMQGVEPVYGDVGTSFSGRILAKKAGKYFIYEITGEDFSGKRIYDMSGCMELEYATSYAFSEMNDEFYYAVGNKLYVAILNADNKPFARIAYENFGTGEKITHILMHKGSGFTTWGEKSDGTPLWRESEHNILSVATYNEVKKEGKVYALPIQYGGNGGIADGKYIRIFDKFNRITALATK